MAHQCMAHYTVRQALHLASAEMHGKDALFIALSKPITHCSLSSNLSHIGCRAVK